MKMEEDELNITEILKQKRISFLKNKNKKLEIQINEFKNKIQNKYKINLNKNFVGSRSNCNLNQHTEIMFGLNGI